jgi:uncharacterized protein (DUF2141 family)
LRDGAAGNHRFRCRALQIAAITAAAPLLGGANSSAALEVDVQGLRSVKGAIQLCVTADQGRFPDCAADRSARHITVPAGRSGRIRIEGLQPGLYAVALFHDENANGRLDKFAGGSTRGLRFLEQPANPLRAAELRPGTPGYLGKRRLDPGSGSIFPLASRVWGVVTGFWPAFAGRWSLVDLFFGSERPGARPCRRLHRYARHYSARQAL